MLRRIFALDETTIRTANRSTNLFVRSFVVAITGLLLYGVHLLLSMVVDLLGSLFGISPKATAVLRVLGSVYVVSVFALVMWHSFWDVVKSFRNRRPVRDDDYEDV